MSNCFLPFSSWRAFPPSSPPRSSSPPTTPVRERPRVRVGIRSSPGIGLEIRSAPESDDLPPKHTALPGIKSLFAVAARAAEPDDDDDDDDSDDSEGLSFAHIDARATFFRVSAERGRWRYDPPPPPQRPQALHRQSMPTSSPPPLAGLSVPVRPISEPLPTTSTPPPPQAALSTESTDGDRVTEPTRAYSPLPPSSPPLSSSPLPAMRSISPLSFAPSSPRLPPSSPLSFSDSLPPSDDGDAAAAVVARELFGDEEAKEVGLGFAEEQELGLALQRKGKVTSKLKDEEALRTMDENGVGGRASKTRLAKVKEKRKGREGEGDALSGRKKGKVGDSLEPGSGSGSGTMEKRKTKKEAKRRFEEDHEEENEPAPKQKKQKKAEGNASQRKRCAEALTNSASASKQRKVSASHASSPSPSPSSSSSSPPPPPSKTKPQCPESQTTLPTPTSTPTPTPPLLPRDAEKDALHAEIRGMLIESMATSRASCMPASALYRSAMRSRPSLEAQRSEKEWVEIIERVLGEGLGEGEGGSGVFGKVESSFK
ncbi:hypothetical protein C0993_002989, partial [Termitomyces sp. T159_Od127]